MVAQSQFTSKGGEWGGGSLVTFTKCVISQWELIKQWKLEIQIVNYTDEMRTVYNTIPNFSAA